jgi:hypothetical protein
MRLVSRHVNLLHYQQKLRPVVVGETNEANRKVSNTWGRAIFVVVNY